MNYINNPMEMCCCTLGENNDICVRPTDVLVNAKTHEPLKQWAQPKVGNSYDCVKMFALQRGYTTVKLYHTEAEANAAYAKLTNSLSAQGNVFDI